MRRLADKAERYSCQSVTDSLTLSREASRCICSGIPEDCRRQTERIAVCVHAFVTVKPKG